MKTINGTTLKIYKIPEVLLKSTNWRDYQIDLKKPFIVCPISGNEIFYEYASEPIRVGVQSRSYLLNKYVIIHFPAIQSTAEQINKLKSDTKYVIVFDGVICSCTASHYNYSHEPALRFNIITIYKCFTADKMTLLPNEGIAHYLKIPIEQA